MPGRTSLHLPALSATVLRPAFLPSSPKCSTDSSGLPDPLPPSDDPDWGQLFQHLRHHFLRISLHWASRLRSLRGWFTLPARLAMLLQGRSPFSCDCTLSALITASLTPSVIVDRPSHPI